MKLAETLQAGINYGQGDREIYNSYNEYIQTLHWLQTPLLTDGFALKNLSSLSLTQEGGSSQIEAVFTPAALKQLFEQEIDGTVTAVLVLADDGSVELLRWEQVEVIDAIRPPSPAENTEFSEIISAFHSFSQPLTTQKERQRLFAQALPLLFLFLIFLLSHRRAVPFGKAFQYRFIQIAAGIHKSHSRCTSAVPSPALPRCPTKRTPAYAAYER